MNLYLSETRNHATLIRTLVYLTILSICAQISLFVIHHTTSGLARTFASSMLANEIFHPVILFPILEFILIQLVAYTFCIAWIWFITVSMGELLCWSKRTIYWVGILCWMLTGILILSLNIHFYPSSFFSKLIINHFLIFKYHNNVILLIGSVSLLMGSLLAYINLFINYTHRIIAIIILVTVITVTTFSVLSQMHFPSHTAHKYNKPNIILIGLDSFRPDFSSYFGSIVTRTPNIDSFLASAATFTHVYTPLARTFPSWLSILTAKYPLHNHARNNLAAPNAIYSNDTLAKQLQKAGYETIYATDENRFSNITHGYGFDRTIGPNMGFDDFMLGGLGDFPLSNILMKLPIAQFLFPYNYANRAAAVTYEPDRFLQLLKDGLDNRTNKPLFLVIHLCLSHWPFTWAGDGEDEDYSLVEHYRNSVEGVDQQLGNILGILKQYGELSNSIVMLLSDHGTSLGLVGDRIISEKNYIGNKDQVGILSIVGQRMNTRYQRLHLDDALSVSYGHGTDILSMSQTRVLLALKGYGVSLPHKTLNQVATLIDISPTLLDMMKLAPMRNIDGVSLKKYIFNDEPIRPRPLFFETGDTVDAMESNHIRLESIIAQRINAYRINRIDGLLYLNPPTELFIANKQRAVLQSGWMLVSYPVMKKNIFILVNVATGKWTMNLSSELAKQAPLTLLMQSLQKFYGTEINSQSNQKDIAFKQKYNQPSK